MAEPVVCPWCDRDGDCDCQERMACQDTGIGHVFCGTRPCGCSYFLCCEHTDPEAEQQRITERTHRESLAIQAFLAEPKSAEGPAATQCGLEEPSSV